MERYIILFTNLIVKISLWLEIRKSFFLYILASTIANQPLLWDLLISKVSHVIHVIKGFYVVYSITIIELLFSAETSTKIKRNSKKKFVWFFKVQKKLSFLSFNILANLLIEKTILLPDFLPGIYSSGV